MYIEKISLQNFRNYEDSSFEFSPEGSLIIGQNGVGKTNLLEAISYFTYGKSILNRLDLQLIHHGKENFFIRSNFAFQKSKYEFKAYYNNQKKKLLHIDGKALQKISDLYRHIQVVYSGPDDIFNIFSVPIKRRFFVDMAISKIYPAYMDSLRRFKEALLQRNTLLKKDFTKKEKEAWDKTFCEESKNVVEYRIKFFEQYRKFFKKAYSLIVETEEEVEVYLKMNFYDKDFVEKMMNLLRENSLKEKKYQTSLFGPHLDDFYITIKQKNAFQYGSQGQKRSIVLALKLAISDMIMEINKICPIMIFDDTLAELDKRRSENLLINLIGKHQIFIASPTVDRYQETNLPAMNLSE
ncbi:MAG: DNA replication and repair protein RecF [Candidatus Cloacimonetes bacterium]|nr:DNA replication and repair protein RecF [Candidatus Cloacimonadota bacterium]